MIERIWQTGFEGLLDNEISGYTQRVEPTRDHPHSGDYAWRCDGQACYREIRARLRQCRFGLYYMQETLSAATHAVAHLSWVSRPVVGLLWHGASRTWTLVCGPHTLRAVDPQGLAPGVYTHLGLDIRLHPTGGWLQLTRYGNPLLTYSGLTGRLAVRRLTLGQGVFGTPSVAAPTYYDVYWDHTDGEPVPTIPPARRFVALRPF